MDPPEPSLQVAKPPTRRDTTQPLKKAGERKPGSFAHLPVQQEQQVEWALPQRRVKSIAQRSKGVSLRQPPISRRKTPAMPLNERPSNDGGKRALSRVQAMVPGYPGRTRPVKLLAPPAGKINPKLPKEVRGSTAKPPLLLSPAKSSRASRSRGVPFPARPLDVNGARSRPVYVFHDLEGRAKVPDGLRRQEQRKTADVLADMRGLTKAPVASKFDPFPQPSNLASGVGASGLGFETTPVPDRKWKKQQEARSSFPALEHLSQLYDENEPKKDLYFPEPEQILAMQRVAAMCVFVVSVAMLLFTGYYILWLRDAASLSSHAPFPPGQTDSDDSFPVLPFMFSTEKLATTDSAE
ncbi:hypothetical protein MTO96_036034 [Rhipicephalus appendiculatus]